MLTLTVTANYFFWLSVPLLMFISGKLMQEGGIKYARGENWQPETLAALVCMFTILLPLVAALAAQNFPPETVN